MKPIVTFLIPCHNNEGTVARTIFSIVHLQTSIARDIVIVDDGSSDFSREVIRTTARQVDIPIIVLEKLPGGEASALNAGIGRCTGEFVAIVEADVQLFPDWLDCILPEFKDPRVAGVGGYMETPRDDSWIARLAGYEVEDKLLLAPRQAVHISSCNAMYRRTVFRDDTPFQEDLLNASLDAAFNISLVRQGRLLLLQRTARVYHHYKPTFSEYLRRYYTYARFRPYLKSFALYPQDWYLAFNVLLCIPVPCAIVVVPFLPVPGLLYLLLVVLLQLPQTIRILRREKDLVALAAPAVFVLRNLGAGIGYIVGCLMKYGTAIRKRPGAVS